MRAAIISAKPNKYSIRKPDNVLFVSIYIRDVSDGY